MILSSRNSRPALIYLLHSGNLYGTEKMALATMVGMTEYDRRIVFAPPPSGAASVAQAARDAGFESVEFGSRTELVKQLVYWFLRYNAVDIIGTGVGSSYICHALAKLTGVRLRQLQVAHGGLDDQYSYATKKPLNRLPVGIVAPSPFVEQKLVDHGIHAASIRVIGNFLSDDERFEAVPRAPYDPAEPEGRPADRRRLRVAVVSRLEPIKRLGLLVDAVERERLAGFEFDVYGEGGELEPLRRRAASLPNLHFHGFTPDVKQRLAQADLLLHLCPDEPFGLAILEAFQARLVVIVPDKGGAGSLVEDGITGRRFRANDVESLCATLREVRDLDDAGWQELADGGHLALEHRFSQREGVRLYRRALAELGT